jgi:hypothetical protein
MKLWFVLFVSIMRERVNAVEEVGRLVQRVTSTALRWFSSMAGDSTVFNDDFTFVLKSEKLCCTRSALIPRRKGERKGTCQQHPKVQAEAGTREEVNWIRGRTRTPTSARIIVNWINNKAISRDVVSK